MFFGEDRILAVRQMILAGSAAARRTALAKILPMQRADFVEIFKAMTGWPVTVRLLDPPLHEFLPHGQDEMEQLAEAMEVDERDVARRVQSLQEFNPMLGHRGVRLAITYPEIYEVQTRAIMEAACQLAAAGVVVLPELMVPLVGLRQELAAVRERIVAEAEAVIAETGTAVEYTVGTMIELPRACVTAAAVADQADFFSFGTNDLTQTTFGLSRDDAGRFLPSYLEQQVLERDPFVELDREGVGALVRIGIEGGAARGARSEDRDLWGARRQSRIGGVLSRERDGLRLLLAVPGADRAAGGGAGGLAERAGRRIFVTAGLLDPVADAGESRAVAADGGAGTLSGLVGAADPGGDVGSDDAAAERQPAGHEQPGPVELLEPPRVGANAADLRPEL